MGIMGDGLNLSMNPLMSHAYLWIKLPEINDGKTIIYQFKFTKINGSYRAGCKDRC